MIQGGEEYPTNKKEMEDHLDWSYLLRNCLLKTRYCKKDKGKNRSDGKRGRRCKQLFCDKLKEETVKGKDRSDGKRGRRCKQLFCDKLKEETVGCSVWGNSLWKTLWTCLMIE